MAAGSGPRTEQFEAAGLDAVLTAKRRKASATIGIWLTPNVRANRTAAAGWLGPGCENVPRTAGRVRWFSEGLGRIRWFLATDVLGCTCHNEAAALQGDAFVLKRIVSAVTVNDGA
jgi:hypothetical protein